MKKERITLKKINLKEFLIIQFLLLIMIFAVSHSIYFYLHRSLAIKIQNTTLLQLQTHNLRDLPKILYSWEDFFSTIEILELKTDSTELATIPIIASFPKNYSKSFYDIRIFPIFEKDKVQTTSLKIFFYISLKLPFLLSLLIYLIFFPLVLALYILRDKARKSLFEKELSELNAKEKSEIYLQTAHDIRSPLTALRILSGNFIENYRITLEDVELISFICEKINEITNKLTFKAKNNDKNSLELSSVFCVVIELQKIVAEKKMEFLHNEFFKINFDTSLESDVFIKVDRIEFNRVISNIINNSIESFELVSDRSLFEIFVEVKKTNSTVEIIIKDNGCGISKDLIKKLGTTKISSGKTNSKKSGQGLGLSHAFKSIRSWNGSISIDSKEAEGTVVKIVLPHVD